MEFRPIRCIYLLLFCLPFYSFSQEECRYTLELYDSFEDGWNGGYLTVSVNDISEDYTFEEGSFLEISLAVRDGDELSIRFVPGAFAIEASFSVFDSEGTELFYSGLNPPSGEVYRTTVHCPACPNLLASSVMIDQIRHNRAQIKWLPNDMEGDYLIKVVDTGTSPDDEIPMRLQQVTQYDITGLEERSRYDVYLQGICPEGDTTNEIGPFTFQTIWASDVGISGLISPVSDCGLSGETQVEVTLKNYGGAPQSLIPFNYSVNGVPAAVNQPNDGFFTGILSYDGTFTLSFDATFDFSEPIPYEIKVWTELPEDGNPANDTLQTLIVSIPEIFDYPYRMDFEAQSGGWMIDESASLSPSLELGFPNGNVIQSAASGQEAWITDLNGSYNINERSVLLSPCFDFSLLDEDPELSFYLWVSTEPTFDGLWVEVSSSDGEWTKLGANDGEGTFWYNTIDDIYGDWWSGNNLFGGWRQVRHRLTGLAGEPNVRIRFVFQSDEAVVREGIGIDNIMVAPVLEANLAAVDLDTPGVDDCGSDTTQVVLTFRNEGTSAQQNFSLAYRIDDGPVVEETFADQIEAGTTRNHTFEATFDSSDPKAYTITAWTDLSGDELRSNDTIRWIYNSAGPGIPFLENFEDEDLAPDWAIDTDLTIANGHASGSGVLFDNMWEDDTIFQAVTPLLGPIAADDTLYFAYRYVDFSGFGTTPTVLGPNDALYIEISEDCGTSFNEVFVINAGNHQVKNTPTTVGVALADYEGQWIKIRFRAEWGSGDYYLDLDNVNIRRCPGDLGLQATVVQPSADQNDGSIRVGGTAGIAPYFYRWNNGNRTASMNGLAPGEYAITVVDQQGCSDVISVLLEPLVPTREPVSNINAISLAPNPNSGRSLLHIELKEAAAVRLAIFDPRGSLLQTFERDRTRHLNQAIDLSHLPDGLYFIRVLIGPEIRTVRLIKANVP